MNEKKGNNKKRNRALGIFAIISIVAFVAGYLYVRYIGTHISTDDAFVEGPVHTIASRIPGTVIKIYTSDNRQVEEDKLLLELDPSVYVQRVKEAEAALNMEKERLLGIKAMVKAQEKKVLAMRAALKRAKMSKDELKANLKARMADTASRKSVWKQAETDLKRAENLLNNGAIAKVRFEKIKVAYDTAKAGLDAVRASEEQAGISLKAQDSLIEQTEASLAAEEAMLEQVKKSLKTQKRQIKMREASLNIAQLNLSYTKIRASAGGYITKKSVETGDKIQAGRPLMAIVPIDKVYITANYKETKLNKIALGAKVIIKVDAYPEKTFTGRVESIMAGTGAAFSLFPPENATGNYVKVVQRIPVKILLDKNTDMEHILRPGMSVVPTVIVR